MSIAQNPRTLLQGPLQGQVAAVLERFLERSGASQGDFGKVEEAGHAAILALRGLLMSAGLQASLASAPQAYACPACGSKLSAYGSRQRHVVTAQGEARVRCVRYRCLACEQDHYPQEAANGLSDGHYTTGAKGVIAATASRMPYESAARSLAQQGLSVSAKEVDRKVAQVSAWREAEERAAVGQLGAKARAGRTRRPRRSRQGPIQAQGPAPAPRSAIQSESPPLHSWRGWQESMAAVVSVDGGKVRSPDADPHAQGLQWFDARMGVISAVVPQPAPSAAALAAVDASGAWPPCQGQPAQAAEPGQPCVMAKKLRDKAEKLRDKASTLYVAGPTHVAGPEEIDALFRLLLAARQSDPHPRRRLLFIADGADWIWWRVGLFFPTAVQVLDIYHAAQHVASAAVACWGEDSPKARYWSERARTMLLAKGGPQRVRQALRHELDNGQPVNAEELRKNLAYLHEHQERMPYAQLHAQGLPVGSGVMESAVKQISTQRLRQPGMMWTRHGAERMLRLRAAYLSGNLQHTIQRQHVRLQHTTADYALKA